MLMYKGDGFRINYPDNWEVRTSEDGVAIVPPGAIVAGPDGQSAQAYGTSMTRFQPPSRTRAGWGLVDATNEFIDSMRQANPNLRVIRQSSLRVSGSPALSTLIENDSPLEGQKERDHLVTVRADNRLLAVIFIAPESSWRDYQPAFEAMLRSLELL